MPSIDPTTVAGAVIRFGMALIFAQSALHAARGWHAHIDAVRAYRLLPGPLTVPAAGVSLLANVALAFALLAPATAPAAAVAGCMTLLLYAAAIQINLSRGRTHIDCGCGGTTGEKISFLLVIRNVTCASLLAAAAFCPAHPTHGATWIAIAGAISLAALYFAASQLLANHAAFTATFTGGTARA
jgi:hypothetical protein